MDRILCVTDSDEWRYKPECDDESLLTEAEKRLMWLVEEWAEAESEDTSDGWDKVRMMIYGAAQATINCGLYCSGSEVRMMYDELMGVALERSLTCIREGKLD